MQDGDAFAEVAGMYGGLQTGIGLFCLLALLKQTFYRSGLALLGLTVGSLALARLVGALLTQDPISLYTHATFTYEFITAAVAVCAFARTSDDST